MYNYNKSCFFFWWYHFTIPFSQCTSISFYYLKEASWSILERAETSSKSLLSAFICLITVRSLMTGTMRCSHFCLGSDLMLFMTYCSPELAQIYKFKRCAVNLFRLLSLSTLAMASQPTNSSCEPSLLWAMTVLIFGNLSSVILQSKQFLI